MLLIYNRNLQTIAMEELTKVIQQCVVSQHDFT